MVINKSAEEIVFRIALTGAATVGKQFKKLTEQVRNNRVSFEQSMDGYSKRYEKFQSDLKPIGKKIQNQLANSVVQPSLTAEQAAEGFIDKQRQMAQFSANFKKRLDDGSSSLHTFRSRLHQGTVAMKNMTMSFLGVMFFGMMLTRVFGGLFKPAAKVFGMMELWSTMLLVLFLPIMEKLMPLFIDFVNFFMNLSDNTKLAIGALALVGLVLGIILMVVGQLALGIVGLIIGFEAMMLVGGLIGGILTASFFAILAVVLLVAAGIWFAWQENFLNIKDWMKVWFSGLEDMFNGIKKVVKGVLKVITSLFTGDFETLIEGLELIWDGFVQYWAGFGKVLLSSISIVTIGILRVFKGVFNLIFSAGEWLFQKLDEMTSGWLMKTKNQVANLLYLIGTSLLGTPGQGGVGRAVLGYANTVRNFAVDTPNFEGPGFGDLPEDQRQSSAEITIAPTYNINAIDEGGIKKIVDDSLNELTNEINKYAPTNVTN